MVEDDGESERSEVLFQNTTASFDVSRVVESFR